MNGILVRGEGKQVESGLAFCVLFSLASTGENQADAKENSRIHFFRTLQNEVDAEDP